ncbi:hypothetical protein N7456_012469 [Penicillium angulare]|uniref:Uncharacterized protein n=1 Tax=Penicillium angulare TaxID=116970 RepID=A0A9W9EVR1_9EURO|nr:hypothetical protein N7456_012469 [Penicillium angulare]
MPPASKPYDEYKSIWSPKLIKRIRSKFAAAVDTSGEHVSVVIHTLSGPYTDTKCKVLGVFTTTYVANRKAIDFFARKFPEFLDPNPDGNWDGFYELEPGAIYDFDANEVGWSVSESGELSLKVDSEDECRVFVERQVVHKNYRKKVAKDRTSHQTLFSGQL